MCFPQRNFALTLVTALVLLAGSATHAAGPFSKLVVFGDSLSDTGNVFGRTFGFAPSSPPYYDGRFSNGPVWVERLAEELQLPKVEPSTDDGLNYATGGAETGSGYAFFPFVPNLETQIDDYLDDHNPGQNDLFVVWGGGNDFLGGDQTNPAVPASNLAGHIETLAEGGAKNFLIPNLPPLGKVPRNQGSSREASMDQLSAEFAASLTGQLDALENRLPITIFRLDIFDGFAQVLQDPASFGFSNVSDPALNESNDQVVPNPDEYLFWDDIHPTAAAHAMIGHWTASLLTAPPPLVGDANGDGMVDRQDTVILATHLGIPSGATLAEGDLDDDGRIGLADLALMQANLGQPSPSAVPEPSAVLLMLLGGMFAMSSWRVHRLRQARHCEAVKGLGMGNAL